MANMYKLMPAGDDAAADAVQHYVSLGWKDVEVVHVHPNGRWTHIVLSGWLTHPTGTLEDSLRDSHQGAARRTRIRRKVTHV